MDNIQTIQLKGMLPSVFVSESIPDSEVWRSQLTLSRGGRYLIEAASGGGKSSLCAFIYGNRKDYQGQLLFNDTDTSTLGISQWQEIRRSHIAYLPQELSLFAELTAYENIQLKNRLTGYASDRDVERWMDALGISFRRDYPVGKMSIGQQQRVAVVRSLCQPFDFILLDEPVSHLDADNNRAAAVIIEEEARRQGAAIVTTSVGNPLALDNPLRLKL